MIELFLQIFVLATLLKLCFSKKISPLICAIAMVIVYIIGALAITPSASPKLELLVIPVIVDFVLFWGYFTIAQLLNSKYGTLLAVVWAVIGFLALQFVAQIIVNIIAQIVF